MPGANDFRVIFGESWPTQGEEKDAAFRRANGCAKMMPNRGVFFESS